MERPDYYAVLQVSKDADLDVVRAAYRALSKSHHPDVGGNEVRYKLINQAHDILSDSQLRSEYDLSRRVAETEAITPSQANGAPDAPPSAAPEESADASTLTSNPAEIAVTAPSDGASAAMTLCGCLVITLGLIGVVRLLWSVLWFIFFR